MAAGGLFAYGFPIVLERKACNSHSIMKKKVCRGGVRFFVYSGIPAAERMKTQQSNHSSVKNATYSAAGELITTPSRGSRVLVGGYVGHHSLMVVENVSSVPLNERGIQCPRKFDFLNADSLKNAQKLRTLEDEYVDWKSVGL